MIRGFAFLFRGAAQVVVQKISVIIINHVSASLCMYIRRKRLLQ